MIIDMCKAETAFPERVCLMYAEISVLNIAGYITGISESIGCQNPGKSVMNC